MPEIKAIPEELIALVQVQPVLDSLPFKARNQLIADSSLMVFADAVAMIEEDEENAFLFILLKGEATVIMNGTQAGVLEAGDVAGEISVSGISPPIASVITRGEVEAVAFPATAISEAIREYPEFGRRLRNAALNRITGR